jgi:hypothetical protein
VAPVELVDRYVAVWNVGLEFLVLAHAAASGATSNSSRASGPRPRDRGEWQVPLPGFVEAAEVATRAGQRTGRQRGLIQRRRPGGQANPGVAATAVSV